MWSSDSARFPGASRVLGWGEAALIFHGFGTGTPGVFERWRAAGRSDPILAGFVWKGNVLQGLPEASWVGRAWLPALLLQGLGMEPLPPSPPWFAWLQNERSDPCPLEERRGIPKGFS